MTPPHSPGLGKKWFLKWGGLSTILTIIALAISTFVTYKSRVLPVQQKAPTAAITSFGTGGPPISALGEIETRCASFSTVSGRYANLAVDANLWLLSVAYDDNKSVQIPPVPVKLEGGANPGDSGKWSYDREFFVGVTKATGPNSFGTSTKKFLILLVSTNPAANAALVTYRARPDGQFSGPGFAALAGINILAQIEEDRSPSSVEQRCGT